MSDTRQRRSIGARRNPATEAAVLDAAAELIAERGYRALTMEEVARRAGAGKATLYRWWPGRAHLLIALYNRSKEGLPVPDHGRLADDITDYMFSMFEHWRDPVAGGVLRGLIAEAQSDPDVLVALSRARADRWRHIAALFERAEQRGELAPGTSVAAAEMRVASAAWYLLLNDQMPATREDTAVLVAGLMGPLVGG